MSQRIRVRVTLLLALKGSRLTFLALNLVRLPGDFQTELVTRLCCYIGEVPGIGWKRERNPCQLIYPQTGRHGYRRHLGNLDRPLADHVAAQHLRGPAV